MVKGSKNKMKKQINNFMRDARKVTGILAILGVTGAVALNLPIKRYETVERIARISAPAPNDTGSIGEYAVHTEDGDTYYLSKKKANQLRVGEQYNVQGRRSISGIYKTKRFSSL